MKQHRVTGTVLALVVTTVGLTSCTSSSGSSPSDLDPTTDAAAAVDPVTITLATGDAEKAPSGDQVRHFARRVAALSDGAMEVSLEYQVMQHDPDFERAVAMAVADGEFDLAVVATRAWDLVGVRSLTALNAPFLVTSDELVADIVTGDVADSLMSGLPDAGVVGLGLMPEGLRHPFGFDAPLLEPADYADSTMRVPYSDTAEAVFSRLGADITAEDVDVTTQRGAESSFRLAPSGIGTGNVVLYPKVNALVADADTRERLTDAQWDVLARAADETVAWAVETSPSDGEAARTFCEEGGRIVDASAEDVAAMVDATAPVTESLRENAETAALVTAIEELKSAAPASEPVEPCGAVVDDALAAINGTYETTASANAMREIGITDESIINDSSGEFTITLADGTWSAKQIYGAGPDKGEAWYGTGSYTLEDDLFTWYWNHEPGNWSSGRVTTQPNGDLRFSDHDDGSGPQYVLGSQVMFDHWVRR